jgi:hypothetical protein
VSVTRRSTSGERPRLDRAGLRTLPAAIAAGLVLLASACGGSSGEGVAQVGSTQTTTTGPAAGGSSSTNLSKRDALVAFSACMRANGVPSFPDPTAYEGGLRLTFGPDTGVDLDSPRFEAAQETCQHLLANAGKSTPQDRARELEQALEYSACMRSHGVPSFPDPETTAAGAIQLKPPPGSGVDPNTPQFRAAENACRQLRKGQSGGESAKPGEAR